MVRNRCGICKREFSSTSGLTQHANAVHQGRTTLSQEAAPRYGQTRSTYSVPRPPEHDEILWNTPITITPNTNTPTLTVPQVDDVDDVDDIEDIEDIEMEIDDEPRYNLRSQVKRAESDEESMNEASDEESDEESDKESDEEHEEPETGSQLPIIIDDDFDLEDLQGASLDDALDTIEENIGQNVWQSGQMMHIGNLWS